MVENEEKAPMFNYELKGEWLPEVRAMYDQEQAFFNSAAWPEVIPENMQKIREIVAPILTPYSSPDHPMLGKYHDKCIIEEIIIDGRKYGSENSNLGIYSCIPKGEATNNSSRKALIHFHGGGSAWFRAKDTNYWGRRVAVETDSILFNVDFRNAPETKAPQNYLDSYAAVNYILMHLEDWGISPNRVGLIGESGGAYHVLGVCMQLAKLGEGGKIKLAIIDIPMIGDHWIRTPEEGYNEVEIAQKPLHLTILKLLATNWEHQLESSDPDIFPGAMSDEFLEKVPPTIVMTREFDYLRRDAEEYAARLKAKGKLLEFYILPGTHHSGQAGTSTQQLYNDTHQLINTYL